LSPNIDCSWPFSDELIPATSLLGIAGGVESATHRFLAGEPTKSHSHANAGLAEIGHLVSCNRDGAFCEGDDPKLKLERIRSR
jgi:hypothetical protein